MGDGGIIHARRGCGRALFVLAAVVTGLYLLALATNLFPWLRGPLEWRWPYVVPGSLERLWLPAAVLLAYIGLVVWFQRPSSSQHAGLTLLLAGLMTPVLQVTLLYLDHPDLGVGQLFYRTVSELSGGFYNVGVTVTDVRDFLARFAEAMPNYPVHPQRHPPGLPLLFTWASQFFAERPALAEEISQWLRPSQCHNLSLMNMPDSVIAAALVQMLVPLWLGIVVIPLYYFGRLVYGSAAGQRAALLWPLLPSVGLWATRWNQLYVLFTLLAFICFHLGLTRQRRLGRLFFVLSGLIVAWVLFTVLATW